MHYRESFSLYQVIFLFLKGYGQNIKRGKKNNVKQEDKEMARNTTKIFFPEMPI